MKETNLDEGACCLVCGPDTIQGDLCFPVQLLTLLRLVVIIWVHYHFLTPNVHCKHTNQNAKLKVYTEIFNIVHCIKHLIISINMK